MALSLLASMGFMLSPSYGWNAGVTVALFLCTAGVIPISEAALAHLVSRSGTLDAGRYGKVRLWGSIGFILAVSASGFALQWLGVGWFPAFVVGMLALLLLATIRLPMVREAAHDSDSVPGALSVLRQPMVAWFFAGVFFTVLAHTSLYAFLSLYLVSLGYSKGAIGLLWAVGMVMEVGWFWFQGRWLPRMSTQGWLLLAAGVSVLRFAAIAAWGQSAFVLVLAQCAHALTFAAQHTGCIATINRQFPGRLRGRGQALYSVLGYGASGVVGGVAGGALSEALGFTAVFWAASGAAMLAALCCWRGLMLERRSVIEP